MSLHHCMRFRPVVLRSTVAFSFIFVTAANGQDSPPTRDREPAISLPAGWTTISPREEIRPEFSFQPQGGPNKAGSFVVSHDHREGLDGWFQKSFAVQGGEFYRFHAARKTDNVDVAARAAPWCACCGRTRQGRMVSADVPDQQVKELGHVPTAEPEHPTDGATDEQGWTTVAGVYRAPTKATQAVVELHLQWAPRVASSGATSNSRRPRHRHLARCDWPRSTTSRLANHRGRTAKSTRRYIAEAAKQKADLVVLGETVPSVGVQAQVARNRRTDSRSDDGLLRGTRQETPACTSC